MRIAYLECFSGISGDMFMGALVDAGVPPQTLHDAVAALNIGARLEISRVVRSGISATKVDVWVDGEKDLPREEYWERHSREQEHSADPSLNHAHHHAHGHLREKHSHDHPDAPAGEVATPQLLDEETHSHSHSRGLHEIRRIISEAAISQSAKTKAVAIFDALGRAEAKIHNTSVENVHFHEVGAVDAMVDIVCAAVGAEALAVDELICSPLNVGGGTVKCAHGTFPVPAPATIELLAGSPIYSSDLQAELVTPTGAAIVKTLASRFASFPEMTIEKSGYGAGTRDFAKYPNVARLTVGETAVKSIPTNAASEKITVLEANLDDMNPQVFGYVMDRLLDEGALDAFGIPVQMKKNRPGMLLTVLCNPADETRLKQVIFAETTTLGVRSRTEDRQTLARRWETVCTEWGGIRIKIASMNGTVTNFAPEYEDCRRIASEHHVPLKTVMNKALDAYMHSAERVPHLKTGS